LRTKYGQGLAASCISSPSLHDKSCSNDKDKSGSDNDDAMTRAVATRMSHSDDKDKLDNGESGGDDDKDDNKP